MTPLLSFPTFLIGNPASLLCSSVVKKRLWILAFARMTEKEDNDDRKSNNSYGEESGAVR